MRRTLAAAALLLLPLGYLLVRLFVTGADDPIDFIYALTGSTALFLMFAASSFSLLRPRVNLLPYRRITGLFAFFYALLHLLNFLVFDMELDPAAALRETLEKPFIYLGMTVFVILLFMAATSTRKGFARFRSYHRALYPALLLATIHFVMAQKALSPFQWGVLLLIALFGIMKLLQRLGRL